MKAHNLKIADASIEDLLAYTVNIDDGIVKTKKGDFISTFMLDGISVENMSPQDMQMRVAGINQFIQSYNNGKTSYVIHRVRTTIRDSLKSTTHGFADEFLNRYADHISETFFETKIYLSVCYRPNPIQRPGLFSRAKINLKEWEMQQSEAVDVLRGIGQTIKSTFNAYNVRRLGEYEEDGKMYDSQQEFFYYLVNLVGTKIRASKKVRWDRYLPISSLYFGKEIVETKNPHTTVYSKFLDIKEYPENSEEGFYDALLAAKFEYIETQTFSPLHRAQGLKALKRIKNQLLSSGDEGLSQIHSLEEAKDDVASGRIAFGEYHYSLQVLHECESPKDKAEAALAVELLEKKVGQAFDTLQDAGVSPLIVEGHTERTWAAQHPGNWIHRARISHISSSNFVEFNSLHNYIQGKRSGNPWGEALMLLNTPFGNPFYFNFHIATDKSDRTGKADLGNTHIMGQTGSGKTVLAICGMLHLLKYAKDKNQTVGVWFDKDRGAEIAIRATGGKYISIEIGKQSGFNPFFLDNTPSNIQFLVDLVKFCAGKEKYTTKDEKGIEEAITFLMLNVPKEQRSWAVLRQNLPNVEDESISDRLKKWCRPNEAMNETGGRLGWALDAPADELKFDDANLYGIDYTELLDDMESCPAIMMYLMHRIEQLIDGRNFSYFMDEYWKAIENPVFQDFAKNKQKTIRKQNGLGVFMTQSASDALNNPIARTLIEGCATLIFLPNPTADHDDYVIGFKLTETEFELLRSLPVGSRTFLVKQGTEATVCMLDLKDKKFANDIKLISGTTANVERLDQIRARLGDNPEDWIPVFLQEAR